MKHLVHLSLASLALANGLWLAQPADAAVPLRQAIVSTASRQLGVPYVFGGASRNGFDCSGLVQYVYAKVKVRLPRTADQQFAYGSPVTFSAARPGDLMFFNTANVKGAVTHVGIYVGQEQMVHAPRAGKPVQVTSVGPRSWFRPRLLGIRRVAPQRFELARTPKAWEVAALPAGVTYKVSGGGDAVLWEALRLRDQVASVN